MLGAVINRSGREVFGAVIGEVFISFIVDVIDPVAPAVFVDFPQIRFAIDRPGRVVR